MRWSLVLAASILTVFVETASAQPTPITVDADVITYDSVQEVVVAQGNVRAAFRRYRLFAETARFDLRSGVVVATGRVRLVDPEGQELRGQALTYNTRTEEGFLEPFEGLQRPRVYLQGGRLDVAPARLVAHEATVTTCDPGRPLYRIVARRVEIIPNQEIVAEHASLYLGNVRLLTVPRLSFSLRPGDPGPRLPGFGYNEIDGYWIDYRFPVRLAGGVGHLRVKYGTLSGPMALLTLTRGSPSFSTTLRLGRTQITDDLRIFETRINLFRYDVAEVGVTTAPVRLGSTPFSWTASATAGWYAEQLTDVATTRLDGEVSVASTPMGLAPNLTLATRGAFRVSAYGTGSLRTIATLAATLSYSLDRYTTGGLGYTYVAVGGRTPLSIDVVDPASTFALGLIRAVPDRYRIAATVFYNALIPETGVQAFVNVIVAPNLEVGVFVDYNFRLATFTDIDYTLRWICDCIDIVVSYRQVRREISIGFGLVGFTQQGAPFVPRSPPPPLTLPQPP